MNLKRKYDCLLLNKDNLTFSHWSFVWAKWKKIYWPAMIIKPDDCAVKDAKTGFVWVFWFADHKISMVSKKDLLEFVPNFNQLSKKASSPKLHAAIVEALETLALASDFKKSENKSDILEWALNGFKGSVKECSEIPNNISKYLIKLKKMNNHEDDSSEEDESNSCADREALDRVKKGVMKIENICLGCYSKEIVAPHPLFMGSLCKYCKKRLMETIYAIGDDGKNMCCILCSHPGQLVLCDNIDCHCSYCVSCINSLTDKETRKNILEALPWHCAFCCTSKLKSSIKILKRRNDWEVNLRRFFQPKNILDDTPHLNYGSKKPIRVLSLFDGISTGKLALEKIGIKIDQYYASEIDEACLSVSKFHHGTSIVYLGDISCLSEQAIATICPVDLVIGGSPCNDLSLVNPNRKGLYDNTGTGRLFFDFVYVLQTVRRLNRGKYVFFLYENVAAMSQEDKNTVSQHLMCEPSLIDAKYVSAQTRARYYWGNIPGLHSHSHLYYENDKILESCLIKELNRTAKVKKIRTVTTNRNSLIQDSKMPVEMNGIPDILWIIELERIFGFPDHYTDIGSLSNLQRQALLGRSWSVPVICSIFRPLLTFFSRK